MNEWFSSSWTAANTGNHGAQALKTNIIYIIIFLFQCFGEGYKDGLQCFLYPGGIDNIIQGRDHAMFS